MLLPSKRGANTLGITIAANTEASEGYVVPNRRGTQCKVTANYSNDKVSWLSHGYQSPVVLSI